MDKLVVCDASPLIFLAKLDRLSLINEVVGGEVVVIRRVVQEVLSNRGEVAEMARLETFFQGVRVEEFETERFAGKQLSLSDPSSLAWALENKADRLLVDEALLRKIALAEGLQVVGVLGLLVQGVRLDLLTKAEARADLDPLVEKDGIRISLALYREILKELGE